MSKRVETLIAACFYYSGLVGLFRWWSHKSGQKLVILNYHCAAGADFYRANNADLGKHMRYLRRHYSILNLETALEELYTPRNKRNQGKEQRTQLVLTFDDGYRDNYTHAFELACKLQIPITIFLVPGYIRSGNRFWWMEGEQLVAHAQAKAVEVAGYTYHLNNVDEQKALAQVIDTHVRHATSVKEREEFLISVRKLLVVPSAVSDEENAALPLTWGEVQIMAKSEWISFGAHTMHHPILAYLSDPAEVQYEVSECRAVLEQQVGYPIRSFAYPVGLPEHIGNLSPLAVQKAGYCWAMTTIDGFNTFQTNPYYLHRLVVDVGQHWLILAAKASGVWSFFIHMYQTPSTLMKGLFKITTRKTT